MTPEAYLEELARRLAAIAGDHLVGAWLLGSASLGDFDPVRSDLDVQAVTEERLPLAAREAVVAALSHEALPCPVRGLELVLYARGDLADPAGPAYSLNLNTGPRMDRHVSYHAEGDPRFWFVLDVAIARERARPLLGPPSASVLPALSRRLVLGALRDSLAWYAAHDPAGVVFAACRAWAWAEGGAWLSKGEAARWARERLDDPAPVDAALAQRADPALPPPPPAARRAVLARAEAVLR